MTMTRMLLPSSSSRCANTFSRGLINIQVTSGRGRGGSLCRSSPGSRSIHSWLSSRNNHNTSAASSHYQLQNKNKIKITSKMSFHFASSEYAACFQNLPQPDPAKIRQATVDYLETKFDKQLWYDDPIVTLLNGQKLMVDDDSGNGETTVVDTVNALGKVNGKQILASSKQIELLKEHIRTYKSPYKDLRTQMRQIEDQLLSTDSNNGGYAGFLIGNQCIDFQKQDGITEIEEAIMANTVERRFNDMLLRDESAGYVRVNRRPIYVSCVSNFTNFLDLCRKTIRSLEVGIPCVILGRSNTSQHSYRWTKLLMDLMVHHNIDPGMITFLSCTLDGIKDITQSCQNCTGNLYTTCSRELAASIKSNYPNTVASTGGPNTLVVVGTDDKLPSDVRDAIQMSASIESSGQCTALRHCVLPKNTDDSTIQHILDGIQEIPEAPYAVKGSTFDGVFAKHTGSIEPTTTKTKTLQQQDYKHHDKVDAFYKISDSLPGPGINEFWRKVVVDFSRMDVTSNDNKTELNNLATWLNENQPISLAVNGPRQMALKLGIELFEKTGMVVNTIGFITSDDDNGISPALTCQARPQEAEVFGEFPPRSSLNDYTRFPVVVPSSNPSYDAVYTDEFLQAQQVSVSFNTSTKSLLEEVENDLVRGYCVALIRYLQNVCRQNPKSGFGRSRTAVWGLQRPPIGMKTYVRCKSNAVWDSISPIYTLFHVTNAKNQVELSVEPANSRLIGLCNEHKLAHTVETEDEMKKRLKEQQSSVFNVVHVDDKLMTNFPMVGNFVSLYFPLGHIKSTKPDDEEFQLLAQLSEKWLNTLF